MDLLKRLTNALEALMGYEEELNLPENKGKSETEIKEIAKKKGDAFENYVLKQFDTKKYFKLVDCTRDAKILDVYPESNKHPDLTLEYSKSKDRFAIECKFRSSYYFSKERKQNVIRWARRDQIANYLKYQKETGIPVYIVIGIGNNILQGEAPKEEYCVPLDAIKNYPEIFVSFLKKYKREDPAKNFFWDTKNKTLQ